MSKAFDDFYAECLLHSKGRCTTMTCGPRAWCAAQGDVEDGREHVGLWVTECPCFYRNQAGTGRVERTKMEQYLLRLFRKWGTDVRKQCGKRGECEPRLDQDSLRVDSVIVSRTPCYLLYVV